MSDAKDDTNDGRKSGEPTGRAPLTLKPRITGSVSTGTVRQSFSHGRSKTVVVETKRRRSDTPGAAPVVAEKRPAPAAPAPAKPSAPRPTAGGDGRRPSGGGSSGGSAGGLREEELEARRRAIELARQQQEQRDADVRTADAARRAEEDARRREEAALRPQPTSDAVSPAPSAAAPSAPAPAETKPARPTGTISYSVAPRPSAQPRSEGSTLRTGPRDPSAPRQEREGGGLRTGPRDPAAPRQEREGGGFRTGPRDPSAPRQEREGGGFRTGPRDPSAPRGDRPQGDRPQGDRPRSDRPYGDRPQGDRPQGDRPQGDRGGFRNERAPREGGPQFRNERTPRDGAGGPRPGGPGGPRGEGGRDGAPRGPRPPARPGETVRYSAMSPRPAGPGGRGPAGAGAPPAAPEVGRIRAAPRTGEVRKPQDDEEGMRGKRAGAAPNKAVSRIKGEPKRREGRLTLQAVVGDDGDSADRMRSLASVRRAREREREKRKGGQAEQARAAREVVIPDVITVQELSNRMAVRAVDIIKMLMRQGMMLKINDIIDTDTAELVATEFGHTVKRVSEADVEEGFITAADPEVDTLPRPPVVAVMGHVDHGKTSLLDALRKADVAGAEAGGITQHIGAYQVRLENGERVTFLDTPGHAAFSAMRARGATVTDIVVLVVAADDGIMPQTIEAINHARAAGSPMIVAVNKMDKPGANPQKVINDLLQHEVVAESLGGDAQIIEVSAKTRMGLDNLIEAILLQAEVMELRANPDRTAEGVVIEAKLDKGRGPVATVLVKRGTLKRGDIVVAGGNWGKVRALINERGAQLDEAGPAEPVEILGLDGAPDPGEPFAVVENEARARELTEYRIRKRRDKLRTPVAAVSLTDMMSKLSDKKVKELPLIIKSDVQGSAEAIIGSLDKIGNEEVRARIIHSAAGAITESDVQLAKGAGAPIIGFNVRAVKQARDLAEREGVEIRYYAIIYDLLDDIKGVLSGMLAPIQRETFLGNAEILEVFDITKVGKVAGCRVTEGTVKKGARVRILRDNIVIQEMGVLSTLKRFKDEVNEVVSGQECGMAFNGFQDIKPGDFIECFTVEEIKRTL